jgi:hypothetical protein
MGEESSFDIKLTLEKLDNLAEFLFLLSNEISI